MNDSDTELVVEDVSVIFTNIIRKEVVVDQSSSVSVPEASIHILSIQNEYETNTLDLNELNSASANQRTSNRSPFSVTQYTSNESPSPANQCTANQSPATIITRHTSNRPSKSTSSSR